MYSGNGNLKYTVYFLSLVMGEQAQYCESTSLLRVNIFHCYIHSCYRFLYAQINNLTICSTAPVRGLLNPKYLYRYRLDVEIWYDWTAYFSILCFHSWNWRFSSMYYVLLLELCIMSWVREIGRINLLELYNSPCTFSDDL